MSLFKKIARWYDFKKRGIKIWPGAYVYPTAVIGDNVSVGRNAEIGNKVKIGKNTRIGHGAFIPEGVIIGENCFIGPLCCMTNDNTPPSPKSEWRMTIIEDNAAIGAGCVIKPGVWIGKDSKLGCGSVVTKDIPHNEIWCGNPAYPLKQPSAINARNLRYMEVRHGKP